MRTCEVWKNASDAEFDSATEGMEKLVMNRLYDFTFAPQAAHAVPPKQYNPDDLERDRVLAQRISLFGWIEESHLDIPLDEGSQGFVMFAQQELLKINHYKAPRDKLICILNSCKVIFGLIRHLKKEEGADSFLPILIYVLLKANPPHLMSNVEFINRFRNPAKIQGEVGYYLSSLIGAISFIETMDHTSLSNITKEEFENNVEAAIQALPVSNPQSPIISRQEAPAYIAAELEKPAPSPPHAGEESAQPLALSTPALVNSIGEDARRLLQKTGDTISKPLTAISRIFSEALDEAENKLAYLPGPFAPFELGRERREGGDGQPPPQQGPHPQTPSTSTGAPLIQTPYKARVRKVPLSHMPSPNTTTYSPSPGTMAGLSLEDTPSRGITPWQAYTPPQSAGSHQQIHSPAPRGYPHPEQYMYQQVQSAPPLPPRNQPQFQGPVADGAGLQFSGLSPRGPPGTAGTTGPSTVSPLPYVPRTPISPALDVSGVHKETLRQIFPVTDVEVIDLVLETNGGDLGKSIESLLELSSGQ
ncbi:hypothetical protein M378DRAFT_157476 [Amanita muscaria Koide BX008]|uniref:VPS9 domain-containing protein n=1 Tax=Amanita muscaria (strain Koide BX008) TaxID=946122 RepID=A0A0C2XJH7_AMAMK|nr:hypothetical protein M378DRAFT_157476 [Amanita muscaria Koide BX008]